jgi:hypothetical protein
MRFGAGTCWFTAEAPSARRCVFSKSGTSLVAVNVLLDGIDELASSFGVDPTGGEIHHGPSKHLLWVAKVWEGGLSFLVSRFSRTGVVVAEAFAAEGGRAATGTVRFRASALRNDRDIPMPLRVGQSLVLWWLRSLGR